MNSKIRFSYEQIFASLIFVSFVPTGFVGQVMAESRYVDLQARAKVYINSEKNPVLKILNGETEIAPNCKFAVAPLIVMVGNNGNLVKIVDPDRVAQKYLAEATTTKSGEFSIFPLFEDEDGRIVLSTEKGASLMGDGALTILKGMGKLSVGTIIITCIIAGKTGKFLGIQTYRATSWACVHIYKRIMDYYERKRLARDLANIPVND